MSTVSKRIRQASTETKRCVYCGTKVRTRLGSLPGRQVACSAHSDLPELDVPTILRIRLDPAYTFPPL